MLAMLRGALRVLVLSSIAARAHAQSGQVLERAAYVRAVLAANPSVAAARAGLRAALARVREAGAFDDPRIDVSMAPLSIASSHARFGYELGISQQLPWFGKRALDGAVMKAEAAASASDLESTRRDLALAAVLLYDQYYVALRSLEINAQHVALLRDMQTALTSQLEVGRASLQDSLRAETELTHLERDALLLTAERDVLIAQMNQLLHLAPETPLPAAVSELALRAAPDARDSKRLQADAVERRAEIASARFHARSEASKAEAAERAYYPDFSVSTSYSSMWDTPQQRWMVGVGFNVPLPTERRAGAIDEARAARAQYQSEVDRLSDLARTQVYVALRTLHQAEDVLGLFEQRLLPVARQQLDASRAGFIASQTPLVAVIDAERSLRGAELDHRRAQAECDQRRAELDRAMGLIPGLAADGDRR